MVDADTGLGSAFDREAPSPAEVPPEPGEPPRDSSHAHEETPKPPSHTVSASDLRELVSRMVPGSPEAQGAMMFMQYMQQLGMELPPGLFFIFVQ